MSVKSLEISSLFMKFIEEVLLLYLIIIYHPSVVLFHNKSPIFSTKYSQTTASMEMLSADITSGNRNTHFAGNSNKLCHRAFQKCVFMAVGNSVHRCVPW